MSEHDERKRPTPALEWRWNAAYDRGNEYDKNPDWTDEVEVDDEEENRTKFFDPYDPEHVWIKSDNVYDLVRNR